MTLDLDNMFPVDCLYRSDGNNVITTDHDLKAPYVKIHSKKYNFTVRACIWQSTLHKERVMLDGSLFSFKFVYKSCSLCFQQKHGRVYANLKYRFTVCPGSLVVLSPVFTVFSDSPLDLVMAECFDSYKQINKYAKNRKVI